MEFHDAIIVGLAFAALVVSILSIVFGIIFFRAQIRQAQSIAKDNSDFTLQMNILLSEIRTSQNVTEQQIKDQHDKLLDAAIRSGGSSMDAAATSAVQFGEFSERLDSLAKSVAELKDPGKIEAQIKELRKIEETLNTTVRQLVTHVTEEQKTQTQSTIFEKFTEKALRVITTSQIEARRHNHNYVGTEHFLLGLLHTTDGVAAKVLKNMGINLNRVRSAVEFIIGSGSGSGISDKEIGLTPRAKKLIELAIDEARGMGMKEIGTEHLLLGLLREGEGVGASVLDSFSVTVEKVRAEIIKISQKD
jgi:hypothetical protein